MSLPDNINDLVRVCHNQMLEAGWWHDLETGELQVLTPERVGDKLMLIVTEIAEAKEGHRRNLQDDKLPHRPMVEVELADSIIRICDLAGAMSLDLGGALTEKLAYNRQRADHKRENRIKPDGKKT